MPMWNDMDRAFQGSGLTVKVGYGNWKGYGHGTPGPVEGVACHHTAGPPTGDTPSLNTVIYGRSDLPGPLCNLPTRFRTVRSARLQHRGWLDDDPREIVLQLQPST